MDKDKDYNKYKFDQGKSRVDLICPEFIEGIGQILGYGASKYEDNSWQKVPQANDRYYAAAMRHLLAYRRGEDIDAETCKSHLLHAACCLMFLEYFERKTPKPVFAGLKSIPFIDDPELNKG